MAEMLRLMGLSTAAATVPAWPAMACCTLACEYSIVETPADTLAEVAACAATRLASAFSVFARSTGTCACTSATASTARRQACMAVKCEWLNGVVIVVVVCARWGRDKMYRQKSGRCLHSSNIHMFEVQ